MMQIGGEMPFEIIRKDITEIEADAIVFLAPEKSDELSTLHGGKIWIKKAEEGKAEHVINITTPECLFELCSCYEKSLALALEHGYMSIAFPLSLHEESGYFKGDILSAAVAVIRDFLFIHEMDIFIVFDEDDSVIISNRLFSLISKFIERKYVDVPNVRSTVFGRRMEMHDLEISGDLVGELDNIDEGFSEYLLRKIAEKGMSEVECYKRANIDRKLFSKIRSDRFYKVGKNTALAFAVALRLDLKETRILLEKAGYALSRSSRSDIIVEYFIRNGIYDIFEINEALFSFDEALLGQR